jgi:Transposase IS66 family
VVEARAYVQQQPVAYLDETGWREGQQRAWLWTAVTARVTIFVAQWQGGPRALGGAFLGVVGHGSLEWVQLVSHVAPAALLGTSGARYRGDDGAGWAIASDWRGLAGTGAPDVSLVASGPRWHALACEFWRLYAAHPAGDRAAAGGWPNVWRGQDRRALPRDPQAAPGAVDVRASPRGRADEPCGRTGEPSSCTLAQRPCWDPECRRLACC